MPLLILYLEEIDIGSFGEGKEEEEGVKEEEENWFKQIV